MYHFVLLCAIVHDVSNGCALSSVNEDAASGNDARSAAGACDLPLSGSQRRPHPGARLPEWILSSSEFAVPVWWLGVHGGAGESTLETLLSGTAAANHSWPLRSDGEAVNVVLVARTSARGLYAVQAAMRDWSERHAQRVNVLGLVLVASRPGRVAKELQELVRDVEGATGECWSLPWVDAWELGESPSEINAPRQRVQELTDGLRSALAARCTATTGGSY
jgi:uncharacterized protein DUF6668